ncbi:MAG: glycosyltransferase family 2 protein [Selenomonas sp.]|uniref:glycosyltransferase family 2 protein n=1 Tax=Selenomonas sp. TaxID=2053611 RepID=UPI0025DBFAD2|nr:glycosyltransferase family 2 protein [Selenomonas sp.]MCR5439575.1 glycosyltransferase family 2 protein [Selenomonas sp.]
MSKNFRISACCIVKNEAARMQKWLEQAQKYADEIVVVDTGSTDDTKVIAQAFGAKVFDFSWRNDFAAARNNALVQATGDWITFLDADETFCEGEKIRQILTGVQDAEVIAVPIINVDEDDNNQEIQRFYAVRIWQNKTERRYRGKIHEALYDAEKPVKVHYVDALTIWHTGYSSKRIKSKLERNLPLLLEQEKRQETPLVYRYLAETFYGLQRYEEAEKYIRMAIEKEPATVDGRQPLYLCLLDILQARQIDLAEQVNVACNFVQDNPDMVDLKGRLAILLWRAQRREEAVQYAQAFMEQLNRGQSQKATTAFSLLAPIQSILKEWQWELDWKEKNLQEQYDAVLSQCGQVIPFLFAALFQAKKFAGRECLPDSMRRVLEYAAKERDRLDIEDLDGYQAGLNAMERFGDYAARREYAAIATEFSWPVVLATAKRFMAMREWEIAFELYQQVPVEAVTDASDFWYEVGCCLYRLEPTAAVECFERAQANGCKERDIPAYLAWLREEAAND